MECYSFQNPGVSIPINWITDGMQAVNILEQQNNNSEYFLTSLHLALILLMTHQYSKLCSSLVEASSLWALVTIHVLWRLTVIVGFQCTSFLWVIVRPSPNSFSGLWELYPLQRGALSIPVQEQNTPSEPQTWSLNQSAYKWHQVSWVSEEKTGGSIEGSFIRTQPRLLCQPWPVSP